MILFLLVIVTNTYAVSASDSYFGYETRGIILVWLEFLIFSAFIITWLFNLGIITHYGRSIAGRPFIFILVGLTFLALARVYIMFYNFHIYDLEESTLQIGWHLIFYTGLISFLLSINKLDERTVNNELYGLTNADFVIISSLSLINILTFVLTITFNKLFASRFVNSLFYQTGSVHFLAFILAGYLALKLLKIYSTVSDDELGRLVSTFIPSFLVFLSLMSLNHFWELITESWGILDLNNNVVETIEQVFWLPGYMVTAYGFRRVYNISVNSLNYQEEELFIKIYQGNSPLITNILQIMSHHLGSSALSIAIQSSKDIGVRFSEIKLDNIHEFSKAVHANSRGLVGEFPSKFLQQAINLISTIYN